MPHADYPRIDALYLSEIPALRTGMFMRDADQEKIDAIAHRLKAQKEKEAEHGDHSSDQGFAHSQV